MLLVFQYGSNTSEIVAVFLTWSSLKLVGAASEEPVYTQCTRAIFNRKTQAGIPSIPQTAVGPLIAKKRDLGVTGRMAPLETSHFSAPWPRFESAKA
jgi:hypothetical protein